MGRALERDRGPRLTVAWTPSNPGIMSDFAPIEVELVPGPEAASNRTWTCRKGFGSNWLEAIAPARCSEVLLSARLGNDVSARHLVLELVELLAFKLRDSQPLIRVLFLSTTGPRAVGRHA